MAFCKCYECPDRLEGPINDLRRQLVEADDDILLLEAQLSKRKGQRRALRQQMNTQSSPLLQLPLDLLSEIFTVAFPSGNIAVWSGDSPLLLGSICRMLRDLAWATPKLWCTIPANSSERYSLAVPLLEEWLSRSRPLPVSIFVGPARPKEFNGTDINWKIMNFVARCSERWQHLTLNTSVFFHERYCFYPKYFPNLRTLEMPYLFLDIPSLFEHAPVLQEARLHFRMGIILPAYSLTHLAMDCLNIPDCLIILQRYPNLIQCSFTASSLPFEDETNLFPTVNTPLLESLHLTFVGVSSWATTSFFDSITTPALHELELSMGRILLPHQSLISYIQRSSFQLLKFVFISDDTTEEQLVELLTLLPSLKELKLDSKFGIYIINQLTFNPIDQSSSTGALLPNLTHLSFVIRTEESLDYPALVEMIRSRRRLLVDGAGGGIGTLSGCGNIAQLEAFNVLASAWGCETPPPRTVLAQFQELVDEGMSLRYLPRTSGFT